MQSLKFTKATNSWWLFCGKLQFKMKYFACNYKHRNNLNPK
ncbi:MAG: hypothetical protein CH6_3263 [Candidatus Kapaibacterium sp.]|nr:MAG: hypothetical protein CH6_3263 [Candidatus Kapabacteria bacterium]